MLNASPYMVTPKYTPDARRSCLSEEEQDKMIKWWAKERKRDKSKTKMPTTVRDTVVSYDTAVEFQPQEKVITLRRVCSLFVCASLTLV